ncbi:MAG: DUF4331 family protein [Gemmatimonadaceae bacterium]
MLFRTTGHGSRRIALLSALALAGVAAIAGVRSVQASDHQDNPLVELNPAMDMSDFYAFPGSTADRITLVLNSRPLLTPAQTPGASFDPNILYQFKVDNTGDAKEDRVIQVIFKGTGATQTVEVRGPMAPTVVGGMMNTVADATPAITGSINQVLGSASGMQVYAGSREDPYFLDLETFLRIIPDRKPSTGALSLIPDTPSASSFRAAGSAVDALAGSNVLSIVIELPTSQLTQGGSAKLGLWGTISR